MDSIGFLNLDNNGNRIRQLDYDDYLKVKREQELTELNWGVNARHLIEAFNYSTFKNNPNITLEEYKEKVYDKLFRVIDSGNSEAIYEQEFGNTYIVISSPDKIKKPYLYISKYVEMTLQMVVK